MAAPDSSTTPPGDVPPNLWDSQSLLVPRRFSVGDGERTGRFTIRLTFPGGGAPGSTATSDDEYVGTNVAAVFGSHDGRAECKPSSTNVCGTVMV
jgi:hypothetical protein